MAKKKKVARSSRPMTKKQRSRAQREAQMTRWIIAGAIAVGVLIVGILVYGYLAEVVFRANEPVATINGVPIRTSDFEARVRLRRRMIDQEIQQYQAQRMALDPTNPELQPFLEQLDQIIRQGETQLSEEYAIILGSQVLDGMVQEEIIRQEAERLGLAISDEEIEREIESQFGYDRDADADPDTGTDPLLPDTAPLTETSSLTPTGGMTREEFEESYQNYLQNTLAPSGMSEADFHALIEATLLYERVRGTIVENIPATMDQVEFRNVVFSSQEEAEEMTSRLDGGEAWEDLVAEIEANEESTAYATEPGWQTETSLTQQYGVEIAEALFAAEVGGHTQPLLGSTGNTYVFQITGHEERELDTLLRSYEESSVFDEWIAQQMELVEYAPDWQDKVPTTP